MSEAREKMYYGWWIVTAVFVTSTVSSGLGFYNLPVFLGALTTQQGFSIATASLGTAFFFIASGVAGVAVARLLERFDPRWTFCGGGFLGGAGLVLVGRAVEPWQMFLAYGVLAAGFAASSFVPGTTLVARWFNKRRARALSFATTGLSVGGIALTPLSAHWITTLGLEAASWRIAAIYVLAVVAPALILIRRDPASLGLRMDGEKAKQGEPPAPLDGTLYADAVRSRYFWLITLTFLFALLTQVGGISHQFKLIAVRTDPAFAALGVACLAGSSMVGRLIGGWILGKIDQHAFALGLLVFQALSLVGLSQAESPPFLIAFSILFGASVGNILMMLPLLLAEAYGVINYARIYALSQGLCTVGVASGPAMVGLVHDWAGDYSGGYLAIAGTATISTLVFMLARKEKRDAVSAPL